MNGRSFLTLLLAGFVTILVLLLPAQADDKFDDLVKVRATATKPAADGTQTVSFAFTIEKGWYIYANPVGDKEYEDNRTEINISAKEKLTADVKYPATDKLSKFNHRIYEKSVVIQSQVKRTPGDTSPLQASIDVNVCSHGGKCLPTNTVKLTIP